MAEPTQRKEEVVQEQRTEGMFAAALGTGMEWFDWGIYGIFLPFFAISFFDPEHALAASLGDHSRAGPCVRADRYLRRTAPRDGPHYPRVGPRRRDACRRRVHL